VLEAAGRLAALQGDLAAARALREHALGILEPIEDKAGMLTVLEVLAFVANLQGDCDGAGSYLDRSLGLVPAVNGLTDIAPTATASASAQQSVSGGCARPAGLRSRPVTVASA
jgi:hypothetical protein